MTRLYTRFTLATLATATCLFLPPAAGALELTVQGHLTTAGGVAGDGDYTMTFTLYDAQVAGTQLWTQTKSGVVVSGGLFDALIGDDAANAIMAGVFHDHDEVWLGVTLEAGPGVTTGGDPELPRRPMTAAAWAFSAARAALADSLSCVGCIGTGHLGFDPVTEAELDAMAVLEDLDCSPDQVPVSQGGGWACTSKVASAAAADSATSADLSLDLQCTGCVAEPELGFDPATQAELDAKVAELTALIPTGATLGKLGCTGNGQVPQYDGAGWTCAAVGGGSTPGAACKGAWQALQWDGSSWECVDVRKSGLSEGNANGFEATDDQGFAWDGFQRAARTWPEAKADCEARGGRLPTVTELWRNAHHAEGTGQLGTPQSTDPLWTIIPALVAPKYVQVALANGALTDSGATGPYRCVWPDQKDAGFNGNDCLGGCVGHGRWWNVDKNLRPAMGVFPAISECAFYNGEILSYRDAQELAQRSDAPLTPSDDYAWDNHPVWVHTAGQIRHPLYRIQSAPEPGFNYTANGTSSVASGGYRFRCIGKSSASAGQLPAAPSCQGACLQVDRGRTRRIWDQDLRPNATWADAFKTCSLMGATLPNMADIYMFRHAGHGIAEVGQLTTEVLQHPDMAGDQAFFFAGNPHATLETSERWVLGQGVDAGYINDPAKPHPYRCVWRETFEAQGSATVCGVDGSGKPRNQHWEAATGTFSCTDAVDGDALGKAEGAPGDPDFVDAWGNEWDRISRTAATWSAAAADCASLGARLPTATEIYRIRQSQNVPGVEDAPDATADPLWTIVPIDGTRHYRIKLLDGVMSAVVDSTPSKYRCIWPTTLGNAFSGRACYGPAAEPCFQPATDNIRWDKYNRASIAHQSAAWECAFYGGRLPTVEEAARLIHRGAPNGAVPGNDDVPQGHVVGMAVPQIDLAGNKGENRVYWVGDGTTAWSVGTPGIGFLTGNQPNAFRCVFTDTMD